MRQKQFTLDEDCVLTVGHNEKGEITLIVGSHSVVIKKFIWDKMTQFVYSTDLPIQKTIDEYLDDEDITIVAAGHAVLQLAHIFKDTLCQEDVQNSVNSLLTFKKHLPPVQPHKQPLTDTKKGNFLVFVETTTYGDGFILGKPDVFDPEEVIELTDNVQAAAYFAPPEAVAAAAFLLNVRTDIRSVRFNKHLP